MQTISRFLKLTGIVGAWTDANGQREDVPRIGIGMRLRIRFGLLTDSLNAESGRLTPVDSADLTSCISYYIAFDRDYLEETEPNLLVTSGISVATDEDGVTWFETEIPNTAVPSLVAALKATSDRSAYITLHGEIGGFDASLTTAFAAQFEIEVQKRVYMGGSVPEDVRNDPEYWTGSQIEGYINQPPQIQYSADGKEWHASQIVGKDVYLRLRLGDKGRWTDAIEIPTGPAGKSIYELAVELGFPGTEEEFVASLKGVKGDKGEPGKDGKDGEPGKPGENLRFDAAGELAERPLYADRPEGFIFAAAVTNQNDKFTKLYYYKKKSDDIGDWYPPLVITYYSTPGKDGENVKLIEPVEFTAPKEAGFEYLKFSMPEYPAATVACVCIDTEQGELRLAYDSVYGVTKILQSDGVFKIYFGEHVQTYQTGRVYFTQGLAGLTQYQWYLKNGGTLSFDEWCNVAQNAIPEAPKNGRLYARCNGQWIEINSGGTEPPVDLPMYYGYVPYEVGGDTVNVVEVTKAMLTDAASSIVSADAGTLGKTSIGTVPAGALIVVFLPVTADLKAQRFDGIGGWLPFAENNGADGSGANGAAVTLDGGAYEVYGQFNLVLSEMSIQIIRKGQK